MGPPGAVHQEWLYRRIVLPILALLRMGASPEKLAWSLAVGLLIGINPMLGTSTLLCLAVAFVFRLNVAASQLGNYVAYPLQLVLVVPFLRLGSLVFRTGPMSLSASSLLRMIRADPIAFTWQLWTWEWRALLLWAAVFAVAVPAFALALTPVLRRLLVQVERHVYPVTFGD